MTTNELVTWIATGLFVLSTIFMLISFRKPRRTAPKSLIFSAFMAVAQIVLYLAISQVRIGEDFLLMTAIAGIVIGLIGVKTTRLVPHGGIIWSRNSGFYLLFWGATTAVNQVRSCLNASQGAISLGLAIVSTGSMAASNLSLWGRYHAMRHKLRNAPPTPEPSTPSPASCARCGSERKPAAKFCSRCGLTFGLLLCTIVLLGLTALQEPANVLLEPRDVPNHWTPLPGERMNPLTMDRGLPSLIKEYHFQNTAGLKGLKVPVAMEFNQFALPRTPADPVGETVALSICVAADSRVAHDIVIDFVSAMRPEKLDSNSGDDYAPRIVEQKNVALGDYALKVVVQEKTIVMTEELLKALMQAKSRDEFYARYGASMEQTIHYSLVMARSGSCIVSVLHADNAPPSDLAERTAHDFLAQLVRGSWEPLAKEAGLKTTSGTGAGQDLTGEAWQAILLDQPEDQPIDPLAVAQGSAVAAVMSLFHLIGWLIANRGMSAPDAVRLAMNLMKGQIPDHLKPLIKTPGFKKDLMDYARGMEAQVKSRSALSSHTEIRPEDSVELPTRPEDPVTTVPRVVQGYDIEAELKQMEWLQYNRNRSQEAMNSFMANRRGTMSPEEFQRQLLAMQERIRDDEKAFAMQEKLLRDLGIDPGLAKKYADRRVRFVSDTYGVRRDVADAAQGVRDARLNKAALEHFKSLEQWANRNGVSEAYWLGVGRVVGKDGKVDLDGLAGVKQVLANQFLRKKLGAPEYRYSMSSVLADTAMTTLGDARHSVIVRIGSGYLSGGSSEMLFQSMDAYDRLENLAQHALMSGKDLKLSDTLKTVYTGVVTDNVPIEEIITAFSPNTTAGEKLGAVAMGTFKGFGLKDTARNLGQAGRTMAVGQSPFFKPKAGEIGFELGLRDKIAARPWNKEIKMSDLPGLPDVKKWVGKVMSGDDPFLKSNAKMEFDLLRNQIRSAAPESEIATTLRAMAKNAKEVNALVEKGYIPPDAAKLVMLQKAKDLHNARITAIQELHASNPELRGLVAGFEDTGGWTPTLHAEGGTLLPHGKMGTQSFTPREGMGFNQLKPKVADIDQTLRLNANPPKETLKKLYGSAAEGLSGEQLLKKWQGDQSMHARVLGQVDSSITQKYADTVGMPQGTTTHQLWSQAEITNQGVPQFKGGVKTMDGEAYVRPEYFGSVSPTAGSKIHVDIGSGQTRVTTGHDPGPMFGVERPGLSPRNVFQNMLDQHDMASRHAAHAGSMTEKISFEAKYNTRIEDIVKKGLNRNDPQVESFLKTHRQTFTQAREIRGGGPLDSIPGFDSKKFMTDSIKMKQDALALTRPMSETSRPVYSIHRPDFSPEVATQRLAMAEKDIMAGGGLYEGRH